jgi:hypothetical protein
VPCFGLAAAAAANDRSDRRSTVITSLASAAKGSFDGRQTTAPRTCSASEFTSSDQLYNVNNMYHVYFDSITNFKNYIFLKVFQCDNPDAAAAAIGLVPPFLYLSLSLSLFLSQQPLLLMIVGRCCQLIRRLLWDHQSRQQGGRKV